MPVNGELKLRELSLRIQERVPPGDPIHSVDERAHDERTRDIGVCESQVPTRPGVDLLVRDNSPPREWRLGRGYDERVEIPLDPLAGVTDLHHELRTLLISEPLEPGLVLLHSRDDEVPPTKIAGALKRAASDRDVRVCGIICHPRAITDLLILRICDEVLLGEPVITERLTELPDSRVPPLPPKWRPHVKPQSVLEESLHSPEQIGVVTIYKNTTHGSPKNLSHCAPTTSREKTSSARERWWSLA